MEKENEFLQLEENIINALKEIYDPEIPVNVYDLGLIYDIDIDDEDPPEPMIGGRFDLGETMVQLVAQEIDPFPRKPGLPYADFSTATGHHEKDHAEPSENPFAVLENLKDKLR